MQNNIKMGHVLNISFRNIQFYFQKAWLTSSLSKSVHEEMA